MKLIEDYKLKMLIESGLIYNELIALGVDNWPGYDEVNVPIEEIEEDFDNFASIEQLDIKETDTIRITIDQDLFDIDEAQSILKLFAEIFPGNRIFISFKGIDMTIEENK